jgi:hypothetical protein
MEPMFSPIRNSRQKYDVAWAANLFHGKKSDPGLALKIEYFLSMLDCIGLAAGSVKNFV